jgi:hypothetical protein
MTKKKQSKKRCVEVNPTCLKCKHFEPNINPEESKYCKSCEGDNFESLV